YAPTYSREAVYLVRIFVGILRDHSLGLAAIRQFLRSRSHREACMTPRRISYDARLAIEPFRGMGKYLRTLIAHRKEALMGFCATGESSESLSLIAEGARFYPAWEQYSLPKQVARFGSDVFIAPYNTAPLRLRSGVRLVLIVHDLIFLEPAPLSPSL